MDQKINFLIKAFTDNLFYGKIKVPFYFLFQNLRKRKKSKMLINDYSLTILRQEYEKKTQFLMINKEFGIYQFGKMLFEWNRHQNSHLEKSIDKLLPKNICQPQILQKIISIVLIYKQTNTLNLKNNYQFTESTKFQSMNGSDTIKNSSSDSSKNDSELGDQVDFQKQYIGIEKVMLRREQFDDEEEYQRMRAIRRAIRKLNKKQTNKNEKEQRIVSFKDVQAKDVKLFYNLDFIQKMFLIQGDYFVMLDYDESKRSIEEQINFFQSIKYVLSAEKYDKIGVVYLNILTKEYVQYTPFEVISSVLSRSNNQLLMFFYPYLQQYYKDLEDNKRMIHKLNQMMTREQQEQIKQKRNEYFDKKMMEYIRQNFTELDFFMYYKYSQNKIDDPYLQYSKVGMSYPLIALLGTDPDSFINISMRNGFMEFSTKQNKQDQIVRSMLCTMSLKQVKEMTNLQQDITLLTFDEYEIRTQIETHCFLVDYPPELQLIVDGKPVVNEIPHFLSYQINENVIQTLLAKRAKNPQFLKQWENEEFGYTIESQMFLEKYYKDIIEKQIQEKEQKYQHQLKYYYNKECRFKQILPDNVDNSNNSSNNNCSYQHYQNTFNQA